MAIEEFHAETQFAADGADLVFIKRRERFKDAAFAEQLLNPGDTIVMRLDEIGLGGSAGFDGVRVDGALAEYPAAIEIVLAFKNALLDFNKLFADDVAL